MSAPPRVRPSAPSEPLPEGPCGFRWRAATIDDTAGIHAVASDAGAVDHPYVTVPLEEVAADLEALAADGGGDGIVAVDDRERIVAFGLVLPLSLEASPATALLLGAVDPAARGLGLGRRLLGWQRERGLAWLAEHAPDAPRRVQAYVDEYAIASRRAMTAAGLAPVREYLHLRRDARPRPEVALPAGYAATSIDAEHDEVVRVLRDDAFRDAWGSHALDRAAWEAFTARSIFDRGLSRAVLDPSGRVVGFALVEVDPEEHASQGVSSAYLASLGVAADQRGRGVASGLLAELVSRAGDRGLQRVALDVDVASESRALELYERLGFRAEHRRLAYALEHPAA